MRIIVIGAGVAGLATAGLLARDGHQVTLLESNDTVGGRAGSLSGAQIGADPAFRWDTGPSWYLMPEAFDRFYELMGTSTAEQLDLVDLAPGYRVLSGDSDPVDVPVGAEQVAELFESLEPGAGKKVRRYLAEAGDTYRIAVDRFLYTTFSSPAPFLGREVLARAGRLAKLLTVSLQSLVNNRFTDTRTRQILSYPAVFLSSAPATTPALYQLMSYTDLVQGVKYPLGGFAAVVESLRRLAVDNGVEVRTSCPVARIRTDTDRANPLRRVPGLGRLTSWLPGATARTTGVVLADGTELDADAVVSAADLHHTETAMLARGVQTYPEAHWRRINPGVGAVVVMLGVRGELPQLAHHTLLFSDDWTPDFAAVFGEGAPRPLHRPRHRPRCTFAAPRPPTRTSPPRSTRTCSSWCPAPPTRRSPNATSRPSPMPRSTWWPSGPGSPTWPSGSARVPPWGRRTSPPTTTPGMAGRWVWRTP